VGKTKFFQKRPDIALVKVDTKMTLPPKNVSQG
jgi:hypothetical protein